MSPKYYSGVLAMSHLKQVTLLLAISLNAFHASGLADERQRFDEKEIIRTLKDNYRIYLQRNAKKMAQHEVAEFVFHSAGTNTQLLSSLQNVALPICDLDRPAFEWKYVAPSDNERVLKYVGNRNLGEQMLSWTDSIWVRLGGSQERYREGMYCGRPFADSPSIDNYIAIEVDKSLSESIRNRKTSFEFAQSALLQVASKVQSNKARKMRGEVQLSASSGLRDLKITLEVWSSGAKGPILLSKVVETLANEPLRTQTIKIEGKVEAQRQTYMVMKLDESILDEVAAGEVAGRIFIFDARLQPSE